MVDQFANHVVVWSGGFNFLRQGTQFSLIKTRQTKSPSKTNSTRNSMHIPMQKCAKIPGKEKRHVTKQSKPPMS